ncbi:EAL domain-containing protein [Microcoleus sp. FACHB-831]|uniref:EAL domain-containing protein n=1 Tax=Microcoleus sp. FACHB-831 TaxID=2692827 RepID=UPI00168753BD|nr:EAL domain-containing protein [Microcoleus sp. FACHB-831]
MRTAITSLQAVQHLVAFRLCSSASSLRFRLIMLVLVAVVPSFGLTFYTYMEQRRQEAIEVKENALRLTKIASNSQGQLIESTRGLLVTLAQLEQVRQQDSQQCNAIFAKLGQEYPMYANLGVAALDGTVFCESVVLSKAVKVSSKGWFQRAVQTRKFAVGGYQIGPISNKPELVFAYPVLNKTDRVEAVVFADLELEWLNQLAAAADLPPGSAFTVIDDKGTILARYPNPEKWVGRSVTEAPIVKEVLTQQHKGTVESLGLDGVSRLYAFAPLGSASDGSKTYISIGIPAAVALAEADKALARNLSWLGFIGILAIASAWVASDLFVLRQVQALLKATQRLRAGDLSVRTGASDEPGELSQLAYTFDTMTAALEREVIERDAAEAALQKSYSLLQAVFEGTTDAVFVKDVQGRYLMANSITARLMGKPVEEIIGHDDSELLPLEVARQIMENDRKTLNTGQTHTIEETIAVHNTTLTYLSTKGVYRDLQGNIIGMICISRDISDRKAAEEALREINQKLEALVESAPVAINIIDASGKVRLWNPTAERLFAWSEQEVLGHPTPIVPSNKRDKFFKLLEDVLQGHCFTSLETQCLKKDGSVIDVSLSTSPLHNAKGDPIGAMGIIADITESKRMEREREYLLHRLRLEAEDLAALSTVTANAISTLNLDELLNVLLQRIVQVTQADTATILLKEDDQLVIKAGIGIDEQLELGHAIPIGPSFAGIIALTMQPLYVEDAQNSPGVMVNHFHKPQGIKTILGVPLKRNGSLIGVLHVAWSKIHPFSDRALHLLEITAERCAMAILNAKLYEELGKREELYRTLTRNFPNGAVFLFDRDLRYTLAEGLGLEAVGVSKEFFEGKTIWETLPPETCEHIEPHYRAALAGTRTTFEMLYAERIYLVHTLPVKNERGQIFAGMAMTQDITERKCAEEQLRFYAFYDSLTGLPNRAWFLERLEKSIEEAKEQPDRLFAVLLLDLARFQMVKYSLGHIVADQLLTATAIKLSGCLRPNDAIARVGSDEFAILLPQIREPQDAIRVAERIQQQLTSPFNLDGHELFCSASVGIVLSSMDYRQPEDYLQAADTAMHQAKKSGKVPHAVFVPAMHTGAIARLQLETDLRRALKRQEFRLYYQPIVSLKSGTIKGFEALVRWQHPERGMVSPAEFIPLAEETGLIVPLGAWVLRESCRQMRVWQLAFPNCTEDVTISVNLSGIQIIQPGMIEQIDEILQETELDPSCLKLEITESVIMDNAEFVRNLLEQLKARNILLCIDDFGTGYSSLSYLHRWPIDTLKIDRSFVNGIGVEGHSREIIWTIVTLAGNLGMEVVAEGVETAQQLTQLRMLKRECHYGQGYYFSKPVDSVKAGQLLAADLQW